MSEDLIKREDAIEAVAKYISCDYPTIDMAEEDAKDLIDQIPSAQGRYIDADALVTVCLYDDEHEEHYTERMSIGKCLDLLTEEGCPKAADRPQGWIPCSERLPEDSGDYLVCPSDSVLEDYSDFSEVTIMPYDADCEAFGWWVDRYHPISLGYLDSDFNEFEILAWMPLPKPWKGADDDL